MTSASERRPIVFGVDALEPEPMALAWAADEADRRGLPLRLLSAFSVTVPVSAQAHCPVVVVRAPEHITQDPPYVVVGVDGSESSAAAVDVAFDLAARRGPALRAVWVWQSQLIARFDEEGAVRTLWRLLAETTAGRSMSSPDLELTHEVIRGHPVEELAKASEHALAIVVGRRGRGGFAGMRLGSVPHGPLHRAHCPVVTVPRLPS
ncbi:universal stress protein [Kitasatospora sp. NPDC051705]|uniref:universal stress protein n=1 Tax=Kitasatospora sp. NPDC051705 TaxID=3364057 RepID=UPI0037ACA671